MCSLFCIDFCSSSLPITLSTLHLWRLRCILKWSVKIFSPHLQFYFSFEPMHPTCCIISMNKCKWEWICGYCTHIYLEGDVQGQGCLAYLLSPQERPIHKNDSESESSEMSNCLLISLNFFLRLFCLRKQQQQRKRARMRRPMAMLMPSRAGREKGEAQAISTLLPNTLKQNNYIKNLIAQGNIAALQARAHLWASSICGWAWVGLLNRLKSRIGFFTLSVDYHSVPLPSLPYDLPPPLCVGDAGQPPEVFFHHHLKQMHPFLQDNGIDIPNLGSMNSSETSLQASKLR